ncbi:MAG: CDP-alcohol phosphatidyltransferase family protein [Candidatus Hermodarchaeota archaeon]
MSSKATIPRLLKLKDYVTLIGTTIGIIALICGSFGHRDAISLGFFLISISLGTDLIDGYIARKTKTVNEMGKELDSLSDSLTFGIAPAVLTFQAFKTGTYFDYFLVIGCIFYALGAILRLARFNILTEPGYTGVPTPVSCIIMICYFYTNYFYALAYGGWSYPFLDFAYYAVPFLLMFIGWLNITTHIKFSEKGKIVYILFFLLAPLQPIFGIIGIMNPAPFVSVTISIIFLTFFFLFLGWSLLHTLVVNLIRKRKK